MVERKLQTVRFRALGGPCELQFNADTKEEAYYIADLCRNEVKRIEKLFSRYLPTSVVSQINNAAGRSSIEVDEETAALLNFADACYQQSGGFFDITSGVLRRAWNYKKNVLPSQSAIDELLPLIGWDKVEWDNSSIRLPVEGMEIDFGGFGKEYGVDRACDVLKGTGVSHGLVNFGGDIRVFGGHISRKPWRVGITHPRKVGTSMSSVELFDGAIATSGDYERYMVVDGIRYSHLLNPFTGWPVKSFQSVTVSHESCLIGGCIATTAMLIGETNGESYLEEIDATNITIDSSGRIIPQKKIHLIEDQNPHGAYRAPLNKPRVS